MRSNWNWKKTVVVMVIFAMLFPMLAACGSVTFIDPATGQPEAPVVPAVQVPVYNAPATDGSGSGSSDTFGQPAVQPQVSPVTDPAPVPTPGECPMPGSVQAALDTIHAGGQTDYQWDDKGDQDPSNDIEVYWVAPTRELNTQSLGLVVMGVAPAAGACALVDGPLPIGDVVGIVMVGGAAVAYIYAVTAIEQEPVWDPGAVPPEEAERLANLAITFSMAQWGVAQLSTGVPPLTDHLKKQNPLDAGRRAAAWNAIWTALAAWTAGGPNGPKCWFNAARDGGSWFIAFLDLVITSPVNLSMYTGIGMILKSGPAGQGFHTVVTGVKPLNGGTVPRGINLEGYEPKDCPDFGSAFGWATAPGH